MAPVARKIGIVLGSFLATALMAYLAFLLGAWGFDTRRYNQHYRRLQRLLAQQPTIELVVRGLEDEGTRLTASPSGADLRRAAAEHGGARAAEVVEKGTRWPRTRVFLAGDMVYFIYFDGEGVMRDFTCVSR
jgi:hypothetical protein